MDVSHSQRHERKAGARTLLTLPNHTHIHTHTHTHSILYSRGPQAVKAPPWTRSVPEPFPPRALPPQRQGSWRARRADERQQGREKDGGEGRGETPVPGRAVLRLLRGLGPREIRQRHRQHQRGERCRLHSSLFISCDNDTVTDREQRGRGLDYAGVSVTVPRSDGESVPRKSTVKLPRRSTRRRVKRTHLCAAVQLRAICACVICGVYFTLITVSGITVAPLSGIPPVHRKTVQLPQLRSHISKNQTVFFLFCFKRACCFCLNLNELRVGDEKPLQVCVIWLLFWGSALDCAEGPLERTDTPAADISSELSMLKMCSWARYTELLCFWRLPPAVFLTHPPAAILSSSWIKFVVSIRYRFFLWVQQDGPLCRQSRLHNPAVK